MTNFQAPPTKKNKPTWVLLVLLLLFAVPLVSAWFFTAENDQLGQGTTNHGQLINPPLDLTKLDLRNTQGQPVSPDLWKGRWLLFYTIPNTCDASCEKSIYYLRQIRTATGKNSERVQRAVLTFSQAPDPKLQKLLDTDFAGTLHLVANPTQFADFVHTLPDKKLALNQGAIYLVDPLGNVLMRYRQDTDPMGIYKDLMRLLKISHIG